MNLTEAQLADIIKKVTIMGEELKKIEDCLGSIKQTFNLTDYKTMEQMSLNAKLDSVTSTILQTQIVVEHKTKDAVVVSIDKLLEHIVLGEQEAAKAILQINPQLMLETSTIKDYVGRVFKCSAFTYILWARDSHMLQMMLTCIPATVEGAAMVVEMQQQYSNLMGHGIKYTMASVSVKAGLANVSSNAAIGGENIEHAAGSSFTLQALIQAYKKYLTVLELEKNNTNKWGMGDEAWLGVGKCQGELPANVVQHYCDHQHPLDPCPEFSVQKSTLVRDAEFYNYLIADNSNWFKAHQQLGVEFALARGSAGWAVGGGGGWGAATDLLAIEELEAVRTREIKDLGKQLEDLRNSLLSQSAANQV